MQQINLPQMSTILETESTGSFSIEPLFPGYGSTLGNALRRVLLSSLEGAAVDHVEIDGVLHEFSTIPHVKEDVIEILLHLKMLRFKLATPTADLVLHVKGAGVITGGNFEPNGDCEVINKDHHICHLDKDADVTIRIGVKRGRGYEAIEKKEDRSKAVGVITTDSIFSPVVAVSYKVENTRVGQMTNYDKLVLDIHTDGTIMPSDALTKASSILMEQYQAIANISLEDTEVQTDDTVVHEELIITDDAINILQTLDAKTRIEDAGLTGRTSHALIAAGYKTLSGLKRLSDIKLQSIKGLGSKGVEEVKAVLSRVE
jgi:DNA-directed RNA polymerase subunit alpha